MRMATLALLAMAATGTAGCAHHAPTVYMVSDITGTPAIGELQDRQIFLYSGEVLSVREDHHVALRSLQEAVLEGNRLHLTNQPNMIPFVETALSFAGWAR
jgi:hypothetical protein